MPLMTQPAARLTFPNDVCTAEDAMEICRGLHDPAVLIGSQCRILGCSGAFASRFADDASVVGRSCFQVIHGYSSPCKQAGVSCPLDECRETGCLSRVTHSHVSAHGAAQEEVVCLPMGAERSPPKMFLVVLRPIWHGQKGDGSLAAGLVGQSESFNRMMHLAGRVAPTDATVLLEGESGTGKELVARLIHNQSVRSGRPLVPVDCSGIAESLFESELFGHQKGSFTGAIESTSGLLDACSGGTLFLDEIGDISLRLQAKLLRVLETGMYRRVGSTDERRCDFRLICATNKDLPARVVSGEFRHDLYHRISAFPVSLPPLRERTGDLPCLIRSLTKRLHCPRGCEVDEAAMAALAGYPFPGNVRELLNVLSRACVLSDDGVIRIDHLPTEICDGPSPKPCQNAAGIVPLKEWEQRYLRWASAAYTGRTADLAALLGLTERTLYRKLREAGSASRGRTSVGQQTGRSS